MTFKANNWTKYQQLDTCKNCDINLGPINNKWSEDQPIDHQETQQ